MMISDNNLLTLDSRLKLNNGVEIPHLGLGVYQSSPGRVTQHVVKYALEIGYRHIDTARIYGNEADVGIALRENGIRRDEVFITTKVWNSDQGYDSTLQACEKSLRRLGLSYIDLYLVHWPVKGKGYDTWRAMIRLLHEGKARSIGVSNYEISDLKEILKSEVTPVINQVEFHPFLYQKDLLEFCNKNKIQLEAYSPLTRGMKLNHTTILGIARKYNKTPAQVLIRWSLQHNLVVIPKSAHTERIYENSHVFDFHIEASDMDILNSLDENLHTVFLS